MNKAHPGTPAHYVHKYTDPATGEIRFAVALWGPNLGLFMWPKDDAASLPPMQRIATSALVTQCARTYPSMAEALAAARKWHCPPSPTAGQL